MWPFASRSAKGRIEDLETAVRQLKGDFKALETEWEGVYEKYRVAMSKLARRDMREGAQLPLEPKNGDQPSHQPALSDHALLRSVFPRR